MQPPNDPFAFTLTGDVGAQDPTLLGTVTLQSQACTTDYIEIPSPYSISNGVMTPFPGGNRFCGMGFGGASSKPARTSKLSFDLRPLFTGQSLPFIVHVVTDGTENPFDVANRGFSLNYQQGLC